MKKNNKNIAKGKGKLMAAIVVVVALILGGLYYFSPETVEVQQAEKADIKSIVSETGHIAGDDEVTVYSPVTGRLSEISFAVNHQVKTGDILAHFDLTTFEDDVKQASVNKASQSDGYNAAVAKNNQYKKMLEKASVEGEANLGIMVDLMENRDGLDITRYSKDLSNQKKLKEIEANLTNLSAQMQVAEANYQAVASAGGDTSDARGRVNDLQGQIENNRKNYLATPIESMNTEEYGLYLTIGRQLDLIDRFYNQNVQDKATAEQAIVPEAQLRQYSDLVELAELSEEQAKRALNKAAAGVVSGYEGTIVERMVDPGAVVAEGTPLFRLQPSTGLKAKVMISRFDIGSIELGQAATATIGNNKYTGKVSAIAPVATTDASGKPKVEVTVELDKGQKPTIGLETTVEIETNNVKDTLSIAALSLYSDDEGDYVYLINDGVVEKRYVTIGVKGKNNVQILDGVSEGEQVITSPLTDDDIGMRVSAK